MDFFQCEVWQVAIPSKSSQELYLDGFISFEIYAIRVGKNKMRINSGGWLNTSSALLVNQGPVSIFLFKNAAYNDLQLYFG